ncbi:beta-lactamase family protein [Talaromyces proteolyticus]|uniref:Beta-lactamase family protein n=1 Tax=Talaromyces proteolyticus TaxID=1131652 RepID=A0AAD4Q404_9EURO|nr:beta-lactamase family protein [Talaromyces proteolyticus]KAH8705639.1 beta-lactamase family protein [Talaromyces proteolyticus]
MDFLHSAGFASHVQTLMDQYHVPGLAVAIVQNGSVSSTGFGNASLSPLEPCTADTVFDIASSSKSFTAGSVAMLIDDNENFPEVQYESTMSSLLPDDFVMSDTEYTRNVTLADVVSHRSGLPSHDFSYMSIRAAHPDDARSITRNLRNLPVAAPIRSKYMYCNMMFTVLSYLVEVKSRLSFSDFLEKHIFKPLNMQSTALQRSGARAKGVADRIAMGYFWDEDNSTYVDCPMPESPEAQGAGSIFTSANDFIKWVQALMDHKGTPINSKMYEGLVELRSFEDPNGKDAAPFKYTSPAFYTAGMDVYYYKGYVVVSHDGHDNGYGSRFFFLPDMKFGGVIVGNSDGANDMSPFLAQYMIQQFLEGNASSLDALNQNPAEAAAQSEMEQKFDHMRATSTPQETPLPTYVGNYSNPGYHEMNVQVKDGKLFIDATDRSMGFTLTFEHVANQTEYIAHISDWQEGGDDPVKARFVFEGKEVVKMGLDLEEDLDDLIWFVKETK